MQLVQLLFGKTKRKLKPIMVDSQRKCEQYKTARERSGVVGWHKIEPAQPRAVVWRQKTATIRGDSKTNSGPKRIGGRESGYIKNGMFNSNT